MTHFTVVWNQGDLETDISSIVVLFGPIEWVHVNQETKKKRNAAKRNETQRNETKRSETKQNEKKINETE